MQSFVTNWILKFGQSRRIVKQIGRLTSIRNETLKVWDTLEQYFRKTRRTTNAHYNEETFSKDISPSSLNDETFDILEQYFRKTRRTTDAHNNEETFFKDISPSSLNDETFKLFEIHRIRNRLDPDLVEVPGGYRDLSFKLKIGFVR
jgi:hypothetical protein